MSEIELPELLAGVVFLRPVEPSDMPLVSDSWLRSFSRSKDVRGVPRPLLFDGQRKRIERLTSQAPVQVVALNDARDVVVAWVCRTPCACHYVWVRRDWRRKGLGAALVAGCRRYTHRTPEGKPLTRGRTFNPYEAET